MKTLQFTHSQEVPDTTVSNGVLESGTNYTRGPHATQDDNH